MSRYKVNPVPHSHYIIQWLEGKVVQVKFGDSWEDVPFNEKGNMIIPTFWASQEYRLKPHAKLQKDWAIVKSRPYPTQKVQEYSGKKETWLDVIGEPTWDAHKQYRLVPVISRWTELKEEFNRRAKTDNPMVLEVWAEKLQRWVPSTNPRWAENYEYRVRFSGHPKAKPYDYEKFQKQYDAIEACHTVEYRFAVRDAVNNEWKVIDTGHVFSDLFQYRIIEDPYNLLKKAHKDGIVIETGYGFGESQRWAENETPDWTFPVSWYRIRKSCPGTSNEDLPYIQAYLDHGFPVEVRYNAHKEWRKCWSGRATSNFEYRLAPDTWEFEKKVHAAGGMIVYREIGTTTWLAGEPMFTFGFEYAPAVKVFDQLDKKYQKKLRECEFKIVNEWALKLNEERDRTGKLELDEGNPFKAVMLPLGFKEIDGQYDPKDVAYIRKLMEATMIAATLINLLKSE